MTVSICFISLALILYSLSIWSERIKHQLHKWMIITFIIGFGCDLIGTSIMGWHAHGLKLNFHTICGYLALIIMGLHLAWAIRAFKNKGNCAQLFNHFSIYAWFVWLLALFSGIPK